MAEPENPPPPSEDDEETAPPPEEAPERAASTPPQNDEDAAREQRDAAYTFHNHIAGDQYIDSEARARRRRDGRLPAEDLAALQDTYVKPPKFGVALAALLKDRLVVLVGADGTGRRCGGLALLGETRPSASVVLIPPTLTVDELAAYRFKPGEVHLLADHGTPVTDGSHGVRRYDLESILRELAASDAHLVVTSLPRAGRSHFADHVVEWEPADAPELLRAFRQTHPGVVADHDTDRLLAECVAQTPKDVRALFERVRENGIERALHESRTAARRRVQAWFDDKPDQIDLLRVAVAALIPDRSRRRFGQLVLRLRQLVADLGEGAVVPDPARPLLLELDEIDLVAVHRLDGADDVVGTPSPEMHAAAVDELCERYGPDLLEPLRALQDELAEVGSADDQVAVARGLGLMGTVLPDEVRGRVDQWAGGIAAQRRTAAFTVAWLADSDPTAADALNLASSWCTNRGRERALTAALAFRLTLAERFPTVAVTQLWTLGLREIRLRIVAGAALAGLAHTSAAAGSEELRVVLRTLRNLMRQVLEVNHPQPEQARRGSAVLRDVLSSQWGHDASSLTVTALREHPDSIDVLGQLWAYVLASNVGRVWAIEAIRDDLAELDPQRNAPEVADLGRAIRAHLDEEQWAWLRRDLPGDGWAW